MRRRTETFWVAGPSALLVPALGVVRPGLAADQSPHDLLDRAVAATPDVAHGGALFKHIASVVTTIGAAEGAIGIPQLAGQQRQYLLTQLVQIITLDRFAPKMHQVSLENALDEPQALSDLTAYLAAQPHDSHGEHGDGHRLGRGRTLYEPALCAVSRRARHGQTLGPYPRFPGKITRIWSCS